MPDRYGTPDARAVAHTRTLGYPPAQNANAHPHTLRRMPDSHSSPNTRAMAHTRALGYPPAQNANAHPHTLRGLPYRHIAGDSPTQDASCYTHANAHAHTYSKCG